MSVFVVFLINLSLSYFPYFRKNKSRLMRPQYCVSVHLHLLNNFRMAEPIFMKLTMYIMALEPISTAYFINPSNRPVYLYV
jgi:hypothetical protein